MASGHGVTCLPKWVLYEYLQNDYVVVRSLGEEGIWPTLYAAVRKDQAEVLSMTAIIDVAKQVCIANLRGIVTAELG